MTTVMRATGTPSSASMVNQILLYLLLLGLGAIGGIAGFYGLWQTRCTELLHVADSRYNTSLGALQYKYSEAASGHKRCLEDDTSKQRFQELQNRLEAQTTLAGKHQDLLERHEDTLGRVSELQKANDSSTQTISSLNEQIKRLQRELGQSTVQMQLSKQTREKQVDTLKGQLELSRSMLKEKTHEVESIIRAETKTCRGSDIARHERELTTLQTAVRRQSFARCIARFGQGPYMVQFTLELPSFGSSEPSLATFEIQLLQNPEMANTIDTFLNLVELDLYVGTTIRRQVDGVGIFGGNQKDAINKKVQSELTQRYMDHGYGADPFFLEELSFRAPCDEYTFGILGKGPNFVIPLEPQHQDGSLSCPGLVVTGRETFDKLARLSKKERATIIGTEILALPAAATQEL